MDPKLYCITRLTVAAEGSEGGVVGASEFLRAVEERASEESLLTGLETEAPGEHTPA